MNEDIGFVVGEKYENMKGIFEVIAIHRDQMDIRWESGEEVSTPIALQQRILERMQHEKEMETEQLALKKKARAATAKSRKPFSGFQADDFCLSVSKTSWRGRGQLGGLVTRKLSSKIFKFNSWAVLRQPEIQWLDTDRQKQKDWVHQAKFYARIDESHLFFGFHVPFFPSSLQNSDWRAVRVWVEKAENDSWLLKQCAAHKLYLRDLSEKGFAGRIEARGDHWVHWQDADTQTDFAPLGPFLSNAAKSGEMDLRIEKVLEKQAVIAKQETIADDLAALFGSLAPLYIAAAQKNTT